MFTPKGKFGWFELMTSDTKAAGKFYSDVVGWTTREMSGGGMEYTTFNLGDVGMAGMLHLHQHTGWIGYIAVDDVDAHIEKIVEAGGKLWKPATDVPGMLRFAVMSDPQGAGHRRLHAQPRHAEVRSAPRRPRTAPSAGTSSTPLTLTAHSTSTTNSSAGPSSATWTWGPWASIASLTRATKSRWATAA